MQQIEIVDRNMHIEYFLDYTKQMFWFIYSSVKTRAKFTEGINKYIYFIFKMLMKKEIVICSWSILWF